MNLLNTIKVLCVLLFAFLKQDCLCQKETNCLKNRPPVLHSVFNWYDKDVDPWEVTDDAVQSMINLFSTRFDRAFVTAGITSTMWLPVALSIAKFRAETQSGVQLYLKTHTGNVGVEDRNGTIQVLKGYYDMVRNVHKVNNRTIGGMILRTNLKSYAEDLEVYEEVFGPLDSFVEFKLGTTIDPILLSKSAEEIPYFKKVKFIVVNLDVKVAERPEVSADEIISSCDYLQANARLKGISAEILCFTGYPVSGTNGHGVEGSLDGFHRFWCRIAETLQSGKGHAGIIMRSAFDESSTASPVSGDGDSTLKLKYGWWRRNNFLTSKESDFDEKVESLEYSARFNSQLNSQCNCSESSYFVWTFFIVIIQFGLILYLVGISSTSYFKKLAYNSSPTSEDNRVFEMETSGTNWNDRK